jgi:DNA-binding PadR family transcriptional regulator
MLAPALEQAVRRLLPLTPVAVQVLLALADRDRHGLGIAEQIEAATSGQISPGPGTLYGAIKRLLDQRLIVDAHEVPGGERPDPRRRYYRLTPLGRRALELEAAQLASTLALARTKGVVP